MPAATSDALVCAQTSTATGFLLRRVSSEPSFHAAASRAHARDAVAVASHAPITLDLLPVELVLDIMERLDLRDLARLSLVCRRLFALAYQEQISRKHLDLQPYWPSVTDKFLFNLIARSDGLRRLSLSWSGGGHAGLLSPVGFCTFATMTCGPRLECLRLACCTFVNDDCVSPCCGLLPPNSLCIHRCIVSFVCCECVSAVA
eukprot:m.674460 g.674460  ORF g.674460 m.674460 type:complete len:203 (-) comp22783_c0_seq60:204-812(-)